MNKIAVGKTRANAMIYPATQKAKEEDNLKNNTVERRYIDD